MKLIFDKDSNGTQELVDALGLIDVRTDFSKWKPYIPLSIRRLTAIIGQEVYDKVLDFYQSASVDPDGKLTRLLGMVQQSVALFSFSGWNLYSNICFTTRQQGTNMLLNIFGSTAVNAAAGLATTVQLMIEQVSTNLVMASRPQIIKQYALTDFNAMIQLLKQTTCLANVLYLLVAIPFISEIHYVMNLWLVEVPPYTIEFCILLIVSSFISLNNNIIYIGIQAVGRLKFYSFMAGTVSLSVIPILWLLFSKGIGLTWAFGLPIVSTLLIYIVCSYTLHHYVEDFKPIRFFFTTMVVNLFISIPSFTAILLIQHILVESFTRVIIVALSSSIILVVLSYYVLLDKENKKKVKALILNKLKR